MTGILTRFEDVEDVEEMLEAFERLNSEDCRKRVFLFIHVAVSNIVGNWRSFQEANKKR